jgi:hypothetical protein
MAEEEQDQSVELRDYRGARIADVAPGIDPVVHALHADWMTGNVDTSDTADLVLNQVAAVSPAFALHQRNAAIQAARALDPRDRAVSARSVVLPPDPQRAKEAREGVIRAANYAVDHPLILGGGTGQPTYPGTGQPLTHDDGSIVTD